MPKLLTFKNHLTMEKVSIPDTELIDMAVLAMLHAFGYVLLYEEEDHGDIRQPASKG